MASQIASSMSTEDREAIEGMDMEKMLSHVTQNVFKMINTSPDNANGLNGLNGLDGLSGFMDKFNLGNLKNSIVETQNTVPETKILPFNKNILPKTRNICFDLNVELADFYNGKIKKLNIKRKRVIEENGKQKIIEEKKRIVTAKILEKSF